MGEMLNKTPLGATPRLIWLERRAVELVEAIARYLSALPSAREHGYAELWARELADVLVEMEIARRDRRDNDA